MADRYGLSIPRVTFNGITVSIVPNSLHVVESGKTINVRAISEGGTSTSRVFTPDVTEDYSTATFEVTTDTVNILVIRDFITLSYQQTFEFSFIDPQQNFTGVITHAVICNAPDFKLSADGTVEVIVKGDPVKDI